MISKATKLSKIINKVIIKTTLSVREEHSVVICPCVCVSMAINTQHTDWLVTLIKPEDVMSRGQQLSAELEKHKNCDPKRLKEICRWII